MTIRIIAALLLFANITFSQNHVATTIGYALPILDGGNGIHLGLNPSFELSQFFAVEGQLSYTYAKINKFISGESAKQNSYNGVVGGRLYILEADKSFRPYLNFMVGILYSTEDDPNLMEKSTETLLGYSAGVHCLIENKYVIGLASETPGFFVLKVGYQF